MQVGEQDLPAPQPFTLLRERLLHLHDHLRAVEDFGGVRNDRSPRPLVVVVSQARADAGIRLHDDLMAIRRKLAHGRRDESHAVFIVLDLLRHADQHRHLTGSMA
jgi:hypothetical protein